MTTEEPARRGQAYLAAVDAAAPGLLEGLYLVGSAALGDWQEPLSNIDAVLVAAAWDDAGVAAALAARRHLGDSGEPPRLVLVTFEQLARDPFQPGPMTYVGGAEAEAGEMANPMTWQILAEEGMALRGPEYFTVQVDANALRRWAHSQLRDRWASWAAHAGRLPGQLWRRRTPAEDLLEVTRLHVAATRGQVVSKLRSGAIAVEDLPGRFHRVVTDAVGYRSGSRTSMYWGPVERKHHTLDLIRELTGPAADLDGR